MPIEEKARPSSTVGNLVHSVLAKRTNNTIAQGIRFGMIGALAFAVDTSTLVMLAKHLHLNENLAATVGFLLGMTVSYLLSVRWVFTTRNIDNRSHEFGAFTIIGAVGWALTLLIFSTCRKHVGLSIVTSKVIATGIVFFWNFGARKILLFSTKRRH